MAITSISLLPLGTAFVALAFVVLLGRLYAERRRSHQLIWALGFGLFAAAALLQFYAEGWGWDGTTYRSYYFVAQFLVAVLAAGSFFFVSRRAGGYYLAANLALAALFLVALFYSQVNLAVVQPNGSVAGGQAVGSPAREVSLVFTIPGTLILVGTALYSWFRTRRPYNLLIAAGIAIVATGGSFARIGYPEVLYVFNLAGIFTLFLGFVRSQAIPGVEYGASPAPQG